MPARPPLGDGLVSRRIVVEAADAILVKAVVEAHEGVACVFGEQGGTLIIAAPTDREVELDALLVDVEALIRARRGQ
jgi:hypothetical protein